LRRISSERLTSEASELGPISLFAPLANAYVIALARPGFVDVNGGCLLVSDDSSHLVYLVHPLIETRWTELLLQPPSAFFPEDFLYLPKGVFVTAVRANEGVDRNTSNL
jgi:hypothetical protein